MFDLDRILALSVKDVSRPEQLYDVLESLAREIQRILDSYPVADRHLRELAQDITHLRQSIRVMLEQDGSGSPTGRNILARYLDLEGKVKELRDNTGAR